MNEQPTPSRRRRRILHSDNAARYSEPMLAVSLVRPTSWVKLLDDVAHVQETTRVGLGRAIICAGKTEQELLVLVRDAEGVIDTQ